jgi:hypothetical protein
MELASAYPDSAISAGAMVAIAIVAVATIAIWLVAVFLADRKTTQLSAGRAQRPAAAVTGPDATAEDEHNEAGYGDVARPHRAAA